jgi:M6 family metalloprotease-like protein
MRRLVATLALTVALCPVFASSAAAMPPPRTGELEQLAQNGQLPARLDSARAIGNDRVSSELVAAALFNLAQPALGASVWTQALPPARTTRNMPSLGVVRIPVVLISFPDYPETVATSTVSARVFGSPATGYPRESLRNFYLRSSFGKLDVQGDVLGWYRSPRTRASIAPVTADWSGATADGLVAEALRALDAAGADFSKYDSNGDGYIDHIAVIWTGPRGGWAQLWWGCQPTYNGTLVLDGKRVGLYTWQAESPTGARDFDPGTLIHETGHAMGLPDLYDYDASVGPRGGVGYFDVMDSARYDNNCFSKYMLGWLAPRIISSGTQSVSLPSADSSAAAVLVMPRASGVAPFGEYYMVENRRNAGNDTTPYSTIFPTATSGGLAVWHIDARLSGSDFAWGNSYTSHKLVRLMEADGLESIEGGGPANLADLYAGPTSFGPTSRPSSNDYMGRRTFVTLSGVSGPGPVMTASVAVESGASMALARGATYIRAAATTIDSLSGDAVSMRYNTGAGPTTWVPFASSLALVLPAGDGSKTVTADYTLASGATATWTDSVVLDANAPAGSFVINGGATETTLPTVSIDLSVSDVSPVTISIYEEDGGGSIVLRASGPLAPHMPITLSTRLGVHTIQVMAYDAVGNSASLPLRTINYLGSGPTPVTGVLVSPGTADGAGSWYLTPPTVTLTRDIPGSTLWKWGSGAELSAVTTQTVVPVSAGDRTLSYWSVGVLGRSEAPQTIRLKLDMEPPSTSSNARPSYVNDAFIAFTAADDGRVAQTRYSLDGQPWLVGTRLWVSTLGAHTVEYLSIDEAGRVESTRTVSFSVVALPAPTDEVLLATSIDIRTSATSARIGSVPILSGTVAPTGLIGRNIVVWVKKPGKAYWTYSSNRTVYSLRGAAAWQYKYTFKRGMARGLYQFRASVPAWPGFLAATSPTTVSIRLR